MKPSPSLVKAAPNCYDLVNMQSVYRFIELVTGAKRDEAARALACFMALFLLLTSYYLLKPLRNSMLNREFSPDSLRDLFIYIPVISLAVTRIFNWFYERTAKFRLILISYGLIIACKLYFFVTLPLGGKANTLFFYFWTTVYFLLAISILWGSISTVFKSEAGERTFAFISFGAMGGALVGSKASELLSASAYKGQTLLISALTMAPVLACLYLAQRSTPGYVDTPPPRKAKRQTAWQDFSLLWKLRYVRAIAVMVFALAFMNTILEFRSQRDVDHQLSQQAYQHQFAGLNTWLCKLQPCEGQLHEGGFAKISQLRLKPKDSREAELGAWLQTQRAPFQAPALYAAYGKYQDELDGLTQGYLARINFWTNLLGVVLLLFAARPLFRYLGLRKVLVQLPVCFMAVGAILFFPIELKMMGLILILTGTLNYSLNKTAKELLYTQGDDETRFRFKPLIDGPVMRLGDVSAALLTKFCLDLMHFSHTLTNYVLLIAGLGITLWWFWSSWEVGQEYEDKKRSENAGSSQLATG